ncbi:cytochrome c3 family protein [Ramlibacter sp. AN1133]|uniref:cytochrome c3 family protein n=1 Tax=Ramlibacter sp. AN1133 TaxID=3133429 RepID=UPI0030C4EA6E
MVRKPSGRALARAWGVALAAIALPLCAQISNSKHNLTSTGTGVNHFSDVEDICVFCHTPMGLDASAAVPQWNRTLASPATYQTYDMLGTSTLAGRVAPVGSVSLACLSCHDGAQAMSAIINAPAGWSGGVWSGANQSDGRLRVGIGSNLGSDLRNDHPVGVQYGGGGITASAPGATPQNPDFRSPESAVLNEIRVWWVGTGPDATGTRRKTDLILYTRTRTDGYTGQTDAEPFVECASCHDPHTDRALFLRISNAYSALCLSCHMM